VLGFIVGTFTYITYGDWTLYIYIVLAPAGYLLSCLLYMCFGSRQDDDGDDLETSHNPTDRMRRHGPADGAVYRGNGQISTMMQRMMRRKSIQLKIYHFVPYPRYYVLIKDQEDSDVEGVFRVAALSSLSLGLAQILGIILTFVLHKPLSYAFYLNCVTQLLGWSVTVLYFSTEICETLKDAVRVDAAHYVSADIAPPLCPS